MLGHDHVPEKNPLFVLSGCIVIYLIQYILFGHKLDLGVGSSGSLPLLLYQSADSVLLFYLRYFVSSLHQIQVC